MAQLDVSFLIEDPDFSTTIELIARREAVGDNGRATFCPTSIIMTVVVVPARGRDLIRQDGSSRGSGTIAVYNRTPMSVGGFEPPCQINSADRVIYHGQRYTVENVEDWTDFGAGFVKAIAVQDALK